MHIESVANTISIPTINPFAFSSFHDERIWAFVSPYTNSGKAEIGKTFARKYQFHERKIECAKMSIY